METPEADKQEARGNKSEIHEKEEVDVGDPADCAQWSMISN